MSRFSKIMHRTVTSISINSEMLEEAKNKKINLSRLFDEALSKELLIEDKDAYLGAIERKNKFYKDYIEKRDLQSDVDKYQGGEEDVLDEEEEKPTRENREDERTRRERFSEV